MSKYCPAAIEFIREHCKEGTPSVDANLLRSFFDLLLAVLTPARGVDPKKAERAPLVKLWFIFAFVWAFGGNLVEESRALFDSHVRSSGMLKELDPSFPETVRRDHAEIIAEIIAEISPRSRRDYRRDRSPGRTFGCTVRAWPISRRDLGDNLPRWAYISA